MSCNVSLGKERNKCVYLFTKCLEENSYMYVPKLVFRETRKHNISFIVSWYMYKFMYTYARYNTLASPKCLFRENYIEQSVLTFCDLLMAE